MAKQLLEKETSIFKEAIYKQRSKVKRQRLTNASRLVVKTNYFAISIVSVYLLESETAHFLHNFNIQTRRTQYLSIVRCHLGYAT